MVEFFDFGANIENLMNVWRADEPQSNQIYDKGTSLDYHNSRYTTFKKRLDPRFLEVRESVCLVGFDRNALQAVKIRLSKLLTEPIALESFHVKKVSDITDGAFLVPKIIFVAVHCPGIKLLDEDGDEGQLDLLYDEACEIGADVMVIYIGLPKSIYPPMKRMVYHPKMAEMLFPTQSLLRDLAEKHSLITVTEECEFTHMQKNAIKEWLLRPIDKSHQVYKTASHLTSLQLPDNDVAFWSESEALYNSRTNRRSQWEFEIEEPNFVSATEEHPLAEKAEKKKRKKGKKTKGFKSKNPQYRANDRQLIDFDDPEEIEEYNANSRGGIEMDMYKDNHTYHNDEFSFHMSNSL